MSWAGPLAKPSATDRKRRARLVKVARAREERDAKTSVRRRDRHCRFPLCGCKKLGLRLEVAHTQHKGAGGNPAGDRSTPETMILLCEHRHQHGLVSLHKGTLEARPLTTLGYNGPVAWYVDSAIMFPGLNRYVAREARWAEVARERAAGVLDWSALSSPQERLLEQLAEMNR